MDKLIIDLWPYVMPVFLGGIVTCVGYIYNLKTRVAVLEETIKNLTNTMDSMQRRIDSHSKKQDAILDTLNNIKFELLNRIGVMGTNIATLTTDMQNITHLISISDSGFKFKM